MTNGQPTTIELKGGIDVMHTQQQGFQQNIQKGPVTYNHGGHEVNDVHEVLSNMVSFLEQCVLFRDHIRDQELLQILDNQYRFLTDEYNMLVQCFSTGQDPEHGTRRYQMTQSNETITYGINPNSSPKKPVQTVDQINCACISNFMLNGLKAMASQKTMAAFEVTNPVVRRVLQDSIPNTIEMAYEISLWQNKNGHYQIPQYSEQDMKAILNSYAPVQMTTPNPINTPQ